MALFGNKLCVLLLGNDLIGRPNAKLEIIRMSSACSAYLFMDRIGNTGVVHYVKHIKGAAYPPPP